MHQMLIRSPQNNDGDTFGQFVLVNGVNGERYIYDVLKDEDIDFQEGELYHSLFLSVILSNLDLSDKEAALDQIFMAMPQLSLEDIINAGAFEQVFQKIIKFERDRIPFCYEVPFEEHRMDLNFLIIEEEITRLIHFVLDDTLTQKDIVDLGRLLCSNDILFEIPQLNYLEEPFKKVLEKNISEHENKYLEKVASILQIKL